MRISIFVLDKAFGDSIGTFMVTMRSHKHVETQMNRFTERGQPCPREPLPRNSRTRLSALLSTTGASPQCVFARPRRLHCFMNVLDNGLRQFHISRMALTPSTMLPLGTTAPDFRLPDTNGNTVSLADFKDKPALLVIFMCNHCPYVKHIRSGLVQLANDYQPRGVGIVAINANDVANYPDDSPGKMAEEVKTVGYSFPYLYDESQAVAKAYRAACTPDLFLFDRGRRLVYRGQFDASRPGNGIPVTGKDLRAALDAVLAGKPPSTMQVASMGCNIKWKRGNEPEYY